MTIGRSVFPVLLILVFGVCEQSVRADDKGEIKIITDWTEDERPIRVDCHNLPIIGGGIGGANQSCAARLSLYATFSCFPMKKESVEASCPEWEGLNADIDWNRVAELIDAAADEEDERRREMMQKGHTSDEHLDDDRK